MFSTTTSPLAPLQIKRYHEEYQDAAAKCDVWNEVSNAVSCGSVCVKKRNESPPRRRRNYLPIPTNLPSVAWLPSPR